MRTEGFETELLGVYRPCSNFLRPELALSLRQFMAKS